MLAFAHHVPDIAEHEEIAGDRARQARDIVGVSGHEAGGKAFGKMRRRILLPPRHRSPAATVRRRAEMFFALARSTKLLARSASLAASAASIFSAMTVLVIPQGRIELEIGEFGGIVLRRQNGDGVARMRPQQRARHRAHRHAGQSRTDPQPFHPENPKCFRFPQNGVPLLRHNGPDERRASLGRQDCVEFA